MCSTIVSTDSASAARQARRFRRRRLWPSMISNTPATTVAALAPCTTPSGTTRVRSCSRAARSGRQRVEHVDDTEGYSGDRDRRRHTAQAAEASPAGTGSAVLCARRRLPRQHRVEREPARAPCPDRTDDLPLTRRLLYH